MTFLVFRSTLTLANFYHFTKGLRSMFLLGETLRLIVLILEGDESSCFDRVPQRFLSVESHRVSSGR